MAKASKRAHKSKAMSLKLFEDTSIYGKSLQFKTWVIKAKQLCPVLWSNAILIPSELKIGRVTRQTTVKIPSCCQRTRSRQQHRTVSLRFQRLWCLWKESLHYDSGTHQADCWYSQTRTSSVNYRLQKDPQTTMLNQASPSITGPACTHGAVSPSRSPLAASTQAGDPLFYLPSSQDKKRGASSPSQILWTPSVKPR